MRQFFIRNWGRSCKLQQELWQLSLEEDFSFPPSNQKQEGKIAYQKLKTIHLYEIQHEIKLKEKKRLKLGLSRHDKQKYCIYLTCMVIMTNISHAEKTIKFISDKKDSNLRTAHRIKSTKLMTHVEM